MIKTRMIAPRMIPLVCVSDSSNSAGMGVGVPGSTVGVNFIIPVVRVGRAIKLASGSLQIITTTKIRMTRITRNNCHESQAGLLIFF